MARLMADLPKLKAAIATGDPPTVEPLARDYRARVKADVFVVTDRTGRVLVALGRRRRRWTSRRWTAALAGAETTAFRRGGGRLLEVVTVPVAIGLDPPEVLGTLSLGFALDDALAAQFKGLTGSEVAFALDGRDPRLDPPSSEDDGLPAVLAGRGPRSSPWAATNTWRSPDRSAPRATPTGGHPSLTRRRACASSTRCATALLVAAVAGVAVAVLLSYAVARTRDPAPRRHHRRHARDRGHRRPHAQDRAWAGRGTTRMPASSPGPSTP